MTLENVLTMFDTLYFSVMENISFLFDFHVMQP